MVSQGIFEGRFEHLFQLERWGLSCSRFLSGSLSCVKQQRDILAQQEWSFTLPNNLERRRPESTINLPVPLLLSFSPLLQREVIIPLNK